MRERKRIMRLIIVDNQFRALSDIINLIQEEKIVDSGNIVCVKCAPNNDGQSMLPGNIKLYRANGYEELEKVLEQEIGITEDDKLLLDVELFGEKENELSYNEFGSVKCAEYFAKKYSKLKCKFYSVQFGATRLDFARDTDFKWGEPIVRPIFTETAKEANKKKMMSEKIRRFCND